MGEYERSMEYLRRAVELSPNDPAQTTWNLGPTLSTLIAGRYDEAIAICTMSMEMNPNFPSAYRQRAAALALSGRPDEAWDDVTKLLELEPDTNLRVTAQRVLLRGEHMEKFLDALRAAGLPE
jgi:tetratricopeptide (TPR) repeat protein